MAEQATPYYGLAPLGTKTAGTIAGLAGYPSAAGILGSLGGLLGLGLGASQGNLSTLASVPGAALQLGNLAGSGLLGTGIQGAAGGLGFGAGGGAATGAAAGIAPMLGALAPALGIIMATKALSDWRTGQQNAAAARQFQRYLQSGAIPSQLTPETAGQTLSSAYRASKLAEAAGGGNFKGLSGLQQQIAQRGLNAFNMLPQEAYRNIALNQIGGGVREPTGEMRPLLELLRMSGQIPRSTPIAALSPFSQWAPQWQQFLAQMPQQAQSVLGSMQGPAALADTEQRAAALREFSPAHEASAVPQVINQLQQIAQAGPQALSPQFSGLQQNVPSPTVAPMLNPIIQQALLGQGDVPLMRR